MAAITIPIISDFNDRGVKRAQKAFGNLQKAAAPVGASIRRAFTGAAIAVGALAAASFSAIKAAVEDEKAQALLARQLQVSTKATKDQVAAVENQIRALSLASGVADDELRPAFATLVRSTRNATKAQKALRIALNVSRATGRPLIKVSEALARAYGGNVKALARLDPSLKALITKTTTADQAVGLLARNFSGAAATAAGTFSGKMDRLQVAVNEVQESFGVALLPVAEKFATFAAEKLVPYAEKLSAAYGEKGFAGVLQVLGKDLNSAQQRSTGWGDALINLLGTIAILGATLKGLVELRNFSVLVASIRTTITALGGAFLTFAGVTTGTVAAAFALAAAAVYVLIDALRNPIFRATFGEFIVNGLKLVANAFIGVYKIIRAGLNPILALVGKIPGLGKVIGTPKLADIDFMDFTFDANKGGYQVPREFESRTGSVTINVNGGDPQATVDTITRWYRQNGPNAPWMS
jgi:hypothetical protein